MNLQIAEQKRKLENDLAHMSLVEALDRAEINPGTIVRAEFHYKGALGTTWFKVHRQGDESVAIAQPLNDGPQARTIKIPEVKDGVRVGEREVKVDPRARSRGRNPENIEAWYTPEELNLPERFTGRIRAL
jgi:hypothetical protein